MPPLTSPLLLAQDAGPELLEACRAATSDDVGFLCRRIFELTGENVFLTQVIDYLVAAPIRVLLILALAYLANRLVRRGIRKLIEEMKDPELASRVGRLRKRTGLSVLDTGRIPVVRRAQRAEAVGAVLRSTATVVIWTIAVIMVLAELGVSIGPILASAGIVGVAVGFGAQDVVKDFLSGLFMLLEDQYGVGDIIDVGEAAGVVEGLTLRSTRIRDVYGTLWHVPNGEIRRVGNKSQQWARALLDISVAYGTDIDRASEVIKRVAHEVWQDPEWADFFIDEPEVWGVENFGPDGVDIRLVIKVVPSSQFNVQRELRRRIKMAFDAEGIEIPFPQRTVWVRSDGAGEQAAPRSAIVPADGEEAGGGGASDDAGRSPRGQAEADRERLR